MKTATKQDTDYGVIWFSARTEVDKVNRMVTLDSFVLTKQSFPTHRQQRLCLRVNAFIADLPWSKTIPLDCSSHRWPSPTPPQAQKKYQLYERSAAHSSTA